MKEFERVNRQLFYKNTQWILIVEVFRQKFFESAK